jgi:hypothetical protein
MRACKAPGLAVFELIKEEIEGSLVVTTMCSQVVMHRHLSRRQAHRIREELDIELRAETR